MAPLYLAAPLFSDLFLQLVLPTGGAAAAGAGSAHSGPLVSLREDEAAAEEAFDPFAPTEEEEEEEEDDDDDDDDDSDGEEEDDEDEDGEDGSDWEEADGDDEAMVDVEASEPEESESEEEEEEEVLEPVVPARGKRK